MKLVRSADGTPIACGTVGTGPVVVVVNGAMSTASDARGIADALAGQGFTGVVYDRRARGESGDTRPYVPEREVEDLAAVIEAAGGRAAVLGHSSGAIVALFAASRGVSIEHLFLSEPPFRFGMGEPDPTLPERLQQLVDDGHRGEAVTTFQLEGVGLPKEIVEQIRSSPMFDGLVAIAQSVVYDATIARDLSDPTAEMCAVRTPTTVLLGAETFPLLEAAAPRVADELDSAELVRVPESVGHRVDPLATARVVAERWIV
ncbi:alpha/beta fold hydrolase [Gordonia otitidis]|uniref:Hydrolase n=1 Tax=Gordonia otitidis (strain DSM 44809 / CCUG 52243 / JCM 12355 / NBRC 100426 / IFM 10032) TaxID=1108044 RepID=H5TFS8_GORO1|nr:alpha/beta fold hydrolase [Gordonia otitidis]GAB32336.1 putative hydrolase [Gordonia otitidis NBRC 100426]